MKIYSVWAIRYGDDEIHSIHAFTKLKDAKNYVKKHKQIYNDYLEMMHELKMFGYAVKQNSCQFTDEFNFSIKKERRYNYCEKRIIDCLDYSEEVKRGVYIYCFRQLPTKPIPSTIIYSNVGYEEIVLD